MPPYLTAAALKRAIWDNAFVVMTLTTLIWAGHSIVSKLAVGEIAPMTLTFLRWTVALLPILFAARRTLRADLVVLRQHLLFVGSMGALGYTAFNALFYLAAHYTAALNLSIIQGCVPALVLVGATLFQRAPATAWQVVGTIATMLGVVAIASQGDWRRLAALNFNAGDLMMLVACVLYAYYTLGLRNRPAVSPFGFLAGMAIAALVTSIPPFLWEVSVIGFPRPSPRALGVLVYAALGPAFIAQVLFMRGVHLIGPSRAGVFVNLVPIFGALMAVGLLGEPLAGYHILALALVVGGIIAAQRATR